MHSCTGRDTTRIIASSHSTGITCISYYSACIGITIFYTCRFSGRNICRVRNFTSVVAVGDCGYTYGFTDNSSAAIGLISTADFTRIRTIGYSTIITINRTSNYPTSSCTCYIARVGAVGNGTGSIILANDSTRYAVVCGSNCAMTIFHSGCSV